MKKAFYASIAAVLMLCSCVRSEDWEMLRNPLHVSGQIDPYFGFPVASSQLYLEDVIGLLPQASQYIDTNNPGNLITLKFDTTLLTDIDFSSKKHASRWHSKGTSSHGDTLIIDTTFSGMQDINFFEDNDLLKKIKLSNVIVDWAANLTLNVSNEFQNLDTNKIKAYISNFKINAIGYDNTVVEIPLSNVGTINVGALLHNQSQHVSILNDFDLAALATQLTEIAPKKIQYSANLRLKVAETFLTDPQEILYDSLKINSISINSDINVTFPINISIGYISHTIDTVAFSLGNQLDSVITSFEGNGISLDMKEAQVKLKIQNSLPFDAKLGVVILDQSQTPILTVMDTANSLLAGAPIVPSTDNPSLYVTSGQSTSEVSINIDYNQLKTLQQGKYVRFIVAASTSADANGAQPFVAPRRTDGIGIKMYIKLHPSVMLDIPFGGSLLTK